MAEEHEHQIYLQPIPVRIWHWLNAFGIITLTVSGAQIRFPEYVSLLGSYKSAIYLHNAAGIIVSISFSLWFFYYTFVARSMANLYVPKVEDLKSGILRQVKFYFLTYFLGWDNPHHPSPDNKFNPMQKSVYLAIMFVMMPLVNLSGIFLINVDPLRGLIVMIGGLKLLAVLHILLACCLIAFLPTHVYLATLGRTPTDHIKTMWTGWEDEEEGHGEEQQDESKGEKASSGN